MISVSKTRIDQNCEETVPLTCYFRARFSASRALLKFPIFREAQRVAQVWHSRLGGGPVGILPADYVGFPALPGLPPASPIYIPQTGGFEIT
jgi:hypothetical protein